MQAIRWRVILAAWILVLPRTAWTATLEVGPGRPFARIEDANAKAQAGDTILVHPRDGDEPYPQTAVFVRQQELTFRAAPEVKDGRIKISGKGFDYSGVGRVPRAVFQFNRGTDNCVLDGFDLSGAHNQSHNGAGVRIVEANHVRIRNCAIHNNDMGIMSSGDGTPTSAIDQRIENCLIQDNGDASDPGYNHNLYLGGTSVTLSGCEVHHSLTGHNVKSRAHHTRVEYCYIHDSANREFDLVDSPDTARPQSDAVLIGNVIAKDPKGKGNGTVIHFGQDGGKDHQGMLFLIFNTIVTSSIAPVVDLSAPGAKATLMGNLVSDGGNRQNHQVVGLARNGASLAALTGQDNWFSGGFQRGEGLGLDATANRFERAAALMFTNSAGHNYHLTAGATRQAQSSLSLDQLQFPPPPGQTPRDAEPPLSWQYRHPAGKEKRTQGQKLILGAEGG